MQRRAAFSMHLEYPLIRQIHAYPIHPEIMEMILMKKYETVFQQRETQETPVGSGEEEGVKVVVEGGVKGVVEGVEGERGVKV